jgi:hypothetical protein
MTVKTPVEKPATPAIDPASVPAYQEPEQYCRLGNTPKEHQPDGIYQLNMKEFMPAIDPNAYFVTSGEAVAKAERLEKDIWLMAGKARQLKNLLKKARGPAVYLETERHPDGSVILKRKNPRNPKVKEKD